MAAILEKIKSQHGIAKDSSVFHLKDIPLSFLKLFIWFVSNAPALRGIDVHVAIILLQVC